MADIDLRKLERRLVEGDSSALAQVVRIRREVGPGRPSLRWLRSLPDDLRLAFEQEWLAQDIAAKARRMLRLAGTTQAEVARCSGLSKSVVGRLVRHGETSLRAWAAFCLALGEQPDLRLVPLEDDPMAEDRAQPQ